MRKNSREPWGTISIVVAIAGIDALPVEKSASAMLDNRILEVFCSSFLRDTTITTNFNAFISMAKGATVHEIEASTQRIIFS